MTYTLARGASQLGSYTGNEALTLYKTGRLLPTDTYYDGESETWLYLSSLVDSLTATPPQKPSFYNIVIKPHEGAIKTIILVSLVAASVCFVAVASSGKTDDTPNSHLALIYGEKLLAKQLKAPATAKFSDEDDNETFFQSRKDGMYFVGGYVDAQNSFGADLRSKWSMVVSYDNHEWRNVWYRLGDDQSGSFPEDKAP